MEDKPVVEAELSNGVSQVSKQPSIVVPYDTPQEKDASIQISGDESSVNIENQSLVHPLEHQKTLDEMKKTDRRNFVRKVLKLLILQFAILIGSQILMETIPDAREEINDQPWVALGCFFVSLIVLAVVFCRKNFAKRFPQNIIAMFIFTILSTYCILYVDSCYPPLVVLYAGVTTLVLVGGLTAYSWKTKKDFTFKSSLFLNLSITLIFFCVFAALMRTNFVALILMSIVIICFGFYLIYDIQSIAGGRYEEISLDDYVIATMMLYIDVIVLFLAILKCCGSCFKSS
mmetsp:Transcript_3831/g.8110  ORF Transcript_3831/g.8110 Transcript_3831/m.8110 type:complete len:288 (+) Transcript_3831:107-970(+)